MGNSVSDYKDLRIWNESMELVTRIYELSVNFPQEERYGLTSQLRRSAVSVPSNIAEGNRRGATKEYIRFLRIALGSLGEVETQLLIAVNVNFVKQEAIESLMQTTQQIGRGIVALERALLK